MGRILAWTAGERMEVEWRPAPWSPEVLVRVTPTVEAASQGSWTVLDVQGWGGALKDASGELVGWFASTLGVSLFQAILPSGLGNWLTDRTARLPAGKLAKESYQNPTYHWPNFLLILDRLDLKAGDDLLEVGCGGGVFLERALESGCRAIAVDHSAEMVRLARGRNQGALSEGRATIVQGEADHLPLPDGIFSCAVLTSVFFFLEAPGNALGELLRVLRPGGRIAIFTQSRESIGTPASPEPMASRSHFYEDKDLAAMAKEAGFSEVSVERPGLESYARKAGLSDDLVAVFRWPNFGQLLQTRKPGTGVPILPHLSG